MGGVALAVHTGPGLDLPLSVLLWQKEPDPRGREGSEPVDSEVGPSQSSSGAGHQRVSDPRPPPSATEP